LRSQARSGRAMNRSPRLVELPANDAAIMAFPQLKVAGALPAPATAAAAALGAGGSDTAARIRRLIAAPASLGRARDRGQATHHRRADRPPARHARRTRRRNQRPWLLPAR
jgi:hypothetical protein